MRLAAFIDPTMVPRSSIGHPRGGGNQPALRVFEDVRELRTSASLKANVSLFAHVESLKCVAPDRPERAHVG